MSSDVPQSFTSNPAQRTHVVGVGCQVLLLGGDQGLWVVRLEEEPTGPDAGSESPCVTTSRSPLGRALIGRRAGDIVSVRTPAGEYELEVLGVGDIQVSALQGVASLDSAGPLTYAAALLAACGNDASAARRYERAGDCRAAARAFDRSECWADAGRNYAACWDHADAGRCFEAAKRFKAAAQEYALGGLHNEAGRLFEREGNLECAVRHYRATDNDAALARCLEQIGDRDGAARAYAEAGLHADAARNLDRAGRRLKAAHAYEKAGHWLAAAERFEEAGHLARAAECFRNARCPEDNLRCRALLAEQSGDAALALELYEEAAGAAWWAPHGAEMRRRAQGLRERCGGRN